MSHRKKSAKQVLSNPKRKRARKPALSGAAEASGAAGEKEPPLSDERIWMIKTYMSRMVLPHVKALLARRLGRPDVSPRDYYCECQVSKIDWAPLCDGHKEHCRLACRRRLLGVRKHTRLCGRRLECQLKAGLRAYRGRREPRSMEWMETTAVKDWLARGTQSDTPDSE